MWTATIARTATSTASDGPGSTILNIVGYRNAHRLPHFVKDDAGFDGVVIFCCCGFFFFKCEFYQRFVFLWQCVTLGLLFEIGFVLGIFYFILFFYYFFFQKHLLYQLFIFLFYLIIIFFSKNICCISYSFFLIFLIFIPFTFLSSTRVRSLDSVLEVRMRSLRITQTWDELDVHCMDASYHARASSRVRIRISISIRARVHFEISEYWQLYISSYVRVYVHVLKVLGMLKLIIA
jgi:hypothetical protein